jgi:hypothetical protein
MGLDPSSDAGRPSNPNHPPRSRTNVGTFRLLSLAAQTLEFALIHGLGYLANPKRAPGRATLSFHKNFEVPLGTVSSGTPVEVKPVVWGLRIDPPGLGERFRLYRVHLTAWPPLTVPQHPEFVWFRAFRLGLLRTRGLAAKCCAVPVLGHKRVRKGFPRRRKRFRKKPETGPRSGQRRNRRRSRRQFSEMICSSSGGCSRRGSAQPVL